jgi:manganese-dependent inorganic pyrophosphatase
MSDIYITGHRNPDLDSVSAAWCYARLKNTIDPANTYIPVRCGPLNETTKDQFKRAGVTPPRFLRDVRPKAADIVVRDGYSLLPEDPVYDLVRLFTARRQSSVVQILDGDTYVGLLSLDEITSFFLRENAGERPRYFFLPKNFSRVMRGEWLKHGESERFEASIMTGAMGFEVYRDRLRALGPDLPLLVVGDRQRHLQYAVEKQLPAIILTGVGAGETPDVDFSTYRGHVYRSHEDTAETIRLLRMSLPVRSLLREAPPQVALDELFDDAKRKLAMTPFRGLPVFDGEKFAGFVTRRCFLDRPRKKIIMVDHNELSQSIDGLEDADILEILDHHRLDAERTRSPIFIAVEPVGSTCTIVYHQYLRWGVPVEPDTARLLVAGITSDTVMLKSPTTTEADRVAVDRLCEAAGIEDFIEFAEELFGAASVLTKADLKAVVESDFKEYTEGSVRFGIGQAEVTTLEDVDEVEGRVRDELERVKAVRGLDWAMLLITDVIKEDSVLIATSYPQKERALAYPMERPGKHLLAGVVSRKKQVLPEIIRALNEDP